MSQFIISTPRPLSLLLWFVTHISVTTALVSPFAADDKTNYVVAIDGKGAAPFPTLGLTVPMMDAKGRRYECIVPDVTDKQHITSASKTLEESLNEGKSPLDLLNVLGNKCLYRTIDWWTYEVCYQQHVRQFHNDPATNTLTSEYLLGNYDAAGDQGQVHVDSSGVGLLGGGAVGLTEGQAYKYVAQQYTNGEACDVTDRPRPRTTEVRYVCAPEGRDMLLSVSEPLTCQYVITVATKVLCNHASFKAEEEAVAVVRCRPLEGVHASDPEEGAVEPAAVDGGFAAEREVDEVDDGLQGATDTQHDEL